MKKNENEAQSACRGLTWHSAEEGGRSGSMLLFRVVIVILVAASALLAPMATPQVAAETVPPTVWIPIDPTAIEGAEVLVSPTTNLTHVVWSDLSDQTLWHMARTVSGGWSTPEWVATGTQFDAEFQRNGTLHIVYQNDFNRNIGIFHTMKVGSDMFSLPIPVSYASGDNLFPRLAISGSTIYSVWQSDTPGYWTTYVGSYTVEEVFAAVERVRAFGITQVLVSAPHDVRDGWNSAPPPNGRGTLPDIRVVNGHVYVSWQDGGEVYVMSESGDDAWMLPYEVSYSIPPGVSSLPRLYNRSCPLVGVRVVWQNNGVLLYRDGWRVSDTMMDFGPVGAWSQGLQTQCRTFVPIAYK